MQRFWSWLAVELGKRAGLVALVGLILTMIFGFGITRLEFATGQDSYLDDDDEVAIDNVARAPGATSVWLVSGRLVSTTRR